MDDYLSEQRQIGKVESDGVFTLAETAALEKLQDYTVDPPWLGIVKVVQGLVRLGAPSIELRGNLQIVTELEADLFREDWRSLILAVATPEPLRELALGLWLSLKCCRSIVLSYRQGAVMRLLPTGEAKLLRAGARKGSLRIAFDTPERKLAEKITELGRNSRLPIGTPPPACGWEKPMVAAVGLPEDYPLLEMAVPGASNELVWGPRLAPIFALGSGPAAILIRVPVKGIKFGELRIVRAGLEIQVFPICWTLPGAQVWCTEQGLQFDLSGFQVKPDEALRALAARVHQHLGELLQFALDSEPAVGPLKRNVPKSVALWSAAFISALFGFSEVGASEERCYQRGVWSDAQRGSLRVLLRDWQARLNEL